MGCAALASLAADATISRKAGDAGAVQAVVAALVAHPDSASVAEEACRALWNLAAVPENNARAAPLGGQSGAGSGARPGRPYPARCHQAKTH
jgi:hypothetical protein